MPSQPKATESETRSPRIVEHDTSAAESKPPTERPAPKPIVIPAGTEITIRLAQTIDATKNKAGDSFDGSVTQPILSNGKTVIPASSPVTGTVVKAAKAGKLKGEGRLSVKLTHITIQGVPYTINTATVSRAVSGKGKRSAVMIGGGSGAGALIGGLAGGGKGAAIGAIVGGGAGTAGATLTGNEQMSFPAESALTFKLQQALTLGKHANSGTAALPEDHVQ